MEGEVVACEAAPKRVKRISFAGDVRVDVEEARSPWKRLSMTLSSPLRRMSLFSPTAREAAEVARWKSRRGILYTPRTMCDLGLATAFLRRIERGIEIDYARGDRRVPVVLTGEGVAAWLWVTDKRSQFVVGKVRWRWTEVTQVTALKTTRPAEEKAFFARSESDDENDSERNWSFEVELRDGWILKFFAASRKSRDILVGGFQMLKQHAGQLFGGDAPPLNDDDLHSPRTMKRRRSRREVITDRTFRLKSAARKSVRQFADVIDPRRRQPLKFTRDIRLWRYRRTVVEVDVTAFTNHEAQIWLPDGTRLTLPHPDLLPGMHILGAVRSFEDTNNEYTLDYVAGPFAFTDSSSSSSKVSEASEETTKTVNFSKRLVTVATMPAGTTFRKVHRFDMLLDMADQPTSGSAAFAVFFPIVCVVIFAILKDKSQLSLQMVGSYGSCKDRRSELFYRLLSYQVVHANVRHLAFNAIATFLLALPTELVHGTAAVFFLYEISVIVAGLTSMTTDPYASVVGASGGVYGLLGVHCGAVFLNWNELKKPGPSNRYVRCVVLAALIGTQIAAVGDWRLVSTAAHFGGFYAGFLFSFSLLHDLVAKEQHLRCAGLLLGFASVLVAIFWIASHDTPVAFFGTTLIPRNHRSCCYQAFDCRLTLDERHHLDCSITRNNNNKDTYVLWPTSAALATRPNDTPSCRTLDFLLGGKNNNSSS